MMNNHTFPLERNDVDGITITNKENKNWRIIRRPYLFVVFVLRPADLYII